MFERIRGSHPPGTTPLGIRDVVAKNFAEFKDAMASGEPVDSAALKHAFRLKTITREQYGDLAIEAHEKAELNLKRAREEIKTLSIDAKTGLLGENVLKPTLERLLGELDHDSTLNAVMVIALDMDGLKFLNDAYEHDVGDQALIALADRIKKETKVGDFAFRPKGKDEYTIILPIRKFLPDADFDVVFNNIRTRFEEDLRITIPTSEGDTEFPITFSAGYSIIKKGESTNPDELLRKADTRERENKKIRKKAK